MPPRYSLQYQKQLLARTLRDGKFTGNINILRTEYFESNTLRWVFSFVDNFYKEKSQAPSKARIIHELQTEIKSWRGNPSFLAKKNYYVTIGHAVKELFDIHFNSDELDDVIKEAQAFATERNLLQQTETALNKIENSNLSPQVIRDELIDKLSMDEVVDQPI